MSFSVMVNFLGLSILILFVPPLTNAFSPKDMEDQDSARLLGQSNLLFFFTYDLPTTNLPKVRWRQRSYSNHCRIAV
jgi:hypothetical protein